MCGIAGIFTRPGKAEPDIVRRMMSVIAHRGPDADGILERPRAGLCLGHVRLSIVDLSDTGAQPMMSRSGRYVIVTNGEIYNFRELRKELTELGVSTWRGSSDTEVLLAAVEHWGVEGALRRTEGMFALALWDEAEQELWLARDRFGEKPLYLARDGAGIAFASELSALMTVPWLALQEDPEAVDLFLTLSYVPEPRSIFATVSKVPPGSLIRFSAPDDEPMPQVWWSPVESALAARGNGKPAEAVAAIEQRLEHVVRNQMIADVPLGAFLSGGIDSSLIVAMMQEQSSRPVHTFTIGFDDAAYDESASARAVAEHLGTDHTEVRMDWTEALDLVERLPAIYSEPFADSSQLPTHLVSQVARQKVTVSLSGDAGDEVFGGYNRHVQAARLERLRHRMPAAMRGLAGRAALALSQPRFEALVRGMTGRTGMRLPSEKLAKAGQALVSRDELDLLVQLVRRDEGRITGDGLEAYFRSRASGLSGLSLAEFMMLVDTVTYLPGDILHKVDRAAMAVALETRVPYLDHRLFELAWSQPVEHRIRGGEGKAVLRDLLAKRVPRELFERPKMGFGVPIDRWMRGPLRDWMIDLSRRFAEVTPRHAETVSRARDDYLAGRGHLHHFLWNVAMLQAWRDSRVR